VRFRQLLSGVADGTAGGALPGGLADLDGRIWVPLRGLGCRGNEGLKDALLNRVGVGEVLQVPLQAQKPTLATG
jgi:hypothetical protein